jgi:hypothetical protein
MKLRTEAIEELRDWERTLIEERNELTYAADILEELQGLEHWLDQYRESISAKDAPDIAVERVALRTNSPAPLSRRRGA